MVVFRSVVSRSEFVSSARKMHRSLASSTAVDLDIISHSFVRVIARLLAAHNRMVSRHAWVLWNGRVLEG